MRFLIALVLLLVLMAAVTIGLVAAAVYAVKRSNRISPTAPTPAPTTWIASPTTAARLHRRLRAATRRSGAIARRADGSDPVRRLAEDLEQEALAIGDQLAVVAGAPSTTRRPQLAELDARVRQVEALAQRLADAAHAPPAVPGPVPEPVGLDRLAEELDALEAARIEVDRAERGDPGPA